MSEIRDNIYLRIEAERLRQIREEEIGAPRADASYLSELVEMHHIISRLIIATPFTE